MMSAQSVTFDPVTVPLTVISPLDTVSPGDPSPTPVDLIPEHGCTFCWVIPTEGADCIVVCTRDAGHDGRQHVAEGDETVGVLAVHPWIPEENEDGCEQGLGVGL
jgi:hypothetical protein